MEVGGLVRLGPVQAMVQAVPGRRAPDPLPVQGGWGQRVGELEGRLADEEKWKPVDRRTGRAV